MTTHLTDTQKQTIRIALAKWMGWTDVNWYEDNAGPGFWNGYPPSSIGVDKNGDWEEKKSNQHKHIPNYPADLNACHAIEVKLTDEEHDRFQNELRKAASRFSGFSGLCTNRDFVSASAEHRALAIYRSLNLGELGD